MTAVARNLVDRGLEITAEITRLETELKDINIKLEAAALIGEQIDLNDADREGKQFLAHGSKQTVPVVITADLIHRSFADGGKTYWNLQSLIGAPKLCNFYNREIVWKARFGDGKELRKLAAELLGPVAPSFITACIQRDKNGIPKNKIIVDWSRATDNQQAAA